MSLVQRPAPERRASPGLAINLSSNNPFRNRAVSPIPPSPGAGMSLPPRSGDNSGRVVSTNPFLDIFDDKNTAANPFDPPASPPKKIMPQQKQLNGSTLALFDKLTLGDRRQNENVPPYGRSGGAQPRHRPTRSQEEQERLRNMKYAGLSRQQREQNIFADSVESSRGMRRHRRNSESSVVDNRASLLLDFEEDGRRERRHRDRDGRNRDPKSRDNKLKIRRPRGVDLIDKLDVSGIYGPGLFHHDGPFDACNPHRNRRGNAPMQAFPKDSANNSLGGSGPNHSRLDLDRIHGRGTEGFDDFSTTAATGVYSGFQSVPPTRPTANRQESFNPIERVEPVHGDESMGLGTSTFLEGAPASRVAIRRRESETDTIPRRVEGLQRKKSLAQRIKNISAQRQQTFPNTGRLTSPEPGMEYYGSAVATSPQEIPASYQSAGGMRKVQQDGNPFFADYDNAYERKGQNIKMATEEKIGRPRAPSSPKGNLLERRVTNDAALASENDAKPSGFLQRVKSLKGGRRARPERLERRD